MAVSHWVCLDVGEVLIDETRVWACWAEVLGVPSFTLAAVLGAAVAEGGDHREAFIRLGCEDWRAHEPAVTERVGPLTAADLYPDALPALEALQASGWQVAVAGNQPARRREELIAAGFDVEVITTSDHLGAEKPEPAFFRRLLAELGDPDPATVAYVGDRVDNDVEPAAAAGLRPVWLRRGPWGLLGTDLRGRAALQARSLAELPARLPEAFASPDR